LWERAFRANAENIAAQQKKLAGFQRGVNKNIVKADR
jgi:hypothetical protein